MGCSAHRFHVPTLPAPDHHHVIPQAWQRFWQPPGAAKAPDIQIGLLRGVAPLWDTRTVELCPNCHRGVHERIVALMHGKPAGRDRLWRVARLGLDRFTAAGGSLEALRADGLYGGQ